MDGHAGAVEADEHRFGLHPVDAEANQIGKPCVRLGGTDHLDAVDRERALDDGRDQPPRRVGLLAQGAAAVGGERVRSRAERQRRRDGLEAGPAASLLVPADQERFEPAAPAHHQRAGTRGPAELVRAQADEVGVQGAEVHRHVAARGGGVDVDRDPGLPAQRHHLADRLERAHLVVGPLAVHERGPGQRGVGEPGPQLRRVEPAGAIDPQDLDGRGARRRVADGGVLDRGADDGRTGLGAARAPHRGVDGLGRA